MTRPLVDADDPALRKQLHRALDAIASSHLELHDRIDHPAVKPPTPPVGSEEWVEAMADFHIRLARLQALLQLRREEPR